MSPDPLLCPSASADTDNAVVLGVILGSIDGPRLRPLEQPVPVNEAILRSTAPLPPTQVLRLAAACQRHECRHFSDDRCAFAAKAVRLLPEVSESLPFCTIRGRCRWFAQEAGAACRRCPQVVTHVVDPSPPMAMAGDPLVPAPDHGGR